MARILQPTPTNLDILVAALEQGEIAAVPTETVYGLAGNALSAEAVAQIYKAKGRPQKNPLIVHVGHRDQLERIAHRSVGIEPLLDHFWPGPLTVILKKKAIIPNSLTAGLDTVAVRMPSHPVFRDLMKRCPFPLAAPSANPFGYVSPTRASHVEEQMGSRIEWILDGGPCESGIESTIVSLADPATPILLRFGSISPDQLQEILGKPVKLGVRLAEDEAEELISPGLLKRHYSPHTPIKLFETAPLETGPEEAVIFLNSHSCRSQNHFGLSTSGDLEEVARRLYDCLQTLDKKGFVGIHLELPADEGLGQALRDRMERAAARE